ncbi:unnamed protein product, partial [Adineta steineri]
RKPTRDGSRQPFKRFRFPTVCYRRHHFRKFDSLVNIMPWSNIYLDRRSQQTIIYSLKGGVCILPPLINAHDRIFSVAELIASGYASLARSGVRPIRGIDITFYFQSRQLTGPNVPQINDLTGVFDGGVRTGLPTMTKSTSTETSKPVPTGITRIVINPSTNTIAPSGNPTFEGITFGAGGAYEKL